MQIKNSIERTTIMADQDTTELPPLQEHSGQPQPTNQTKPKATTCNPRTLMVTYITKITRDNYNRRKGNYIFVSRRILNRNNMYA
jgi:hypothetical protein